MATQTTEEYPNCGLCMGVIQHEEGCPNSFVHFFALDDYEIEHIKEEFKYGIEEDSETSFWAFLFEEHQRAIDMNYENLVQKQGHNRAVRMGLEVDA